MSYLQNLKWMRRLQDYSEDEQKTLLALSNERFRWRTKPNISKASGIEPEKTEEVLSGLIEKGLIRASFSKTKKVILGLCERVA